MNVVQIVTLITPDGAFGGPARIAENQTAALRERGHDVTLLAAGRNGGSAPPEHYRLFPARRLVPTAGFSGLVAPGMRAWLRRHVRAADAVHIHLARDLVTLPAAWSVRRAGVPYVVQPQGMIDEPEHPLAAPLDAVSTRRVLRGASAVLHLTPAERASLRTVARGPLPFHHVHNAVPAQPGWQAPSQPPEVLFVSRLHPRKRVMDFVRMACVLLAEGTTASFVVVGADDGDGRAVSTAVAEVSDPSRLRWEGPLDRLLVLDRMRRGSLLVLPAVKEPYANAVLEALSVGRAVVVRDDNGLAPEVRELGCGVVVDQSQEGLEAAVRDLLAHPDRMAAMGERAFRATAEHFSLAAAATRLEEIYHLVAASGDRADSR